MGQWKKRFQASIAGAASLCLLLVGLNHSGGYLQSQAATLTYETVHTISDFSSTTYLGMTNATLDTELYRSAPSSMKFAVPEGSSGVIWRTTYPEPIDLSDGGKYTLEDLGLAFWIYMDTTETNYVYMFQLDSAGSWSKTVLWNKWRNTLTTATGQWAYVVLPLRDATNNGFDITSFRGFRVTQMGSDKPAHTFHIDDLQVVNLNASSYSWEAADIGITTAFSGDNLMLDDRFDLTCAVKNRDKAVAMTGWTMKATVNERLLQIEGDDTQGFSVAAGGTETITLPLLALDGGTGGITLEFFDDNNKLIASREVPVEIGGKRNWSREDIGFTLSWSDDRPAAGETVTLGYTLTNKSKTADISGWTISCRYSPLWIAGDDAPHTVSVPADTSFDGSFSLTFEEGGSGSVLIDLTDGKGNLLSTESIPVTVSGSGYYLGDTHTHSTASDGVGNFLENFQAGREKGMSWIYATDHNADIAQSFDRVQFDAAKSLMRNAGFLAMYGTEITTHMGHMVAYDVDTYYIPDSTDETHSDIPRNITAGAWQTVIDRIAADGALSYLAHPFATTPYPGLGMDPTNTDVYSGYTGIEIINQGESVERYDGNTVSSTLKVYATEYWDRMNIKGEKKYFGISSTDAHATTDVGGFFNGLLLEGLREDNINTALATGSFYGSAGPELRFSLGGKTMGETVYAAVDAQIPIVVKAYNKDAPITKVVLYAFDIGADGIETAYRAGRDNAAVLFEDTDGSEGRNTFEYTGALPLKPGTFYRVEVYADDDLHGYAFSNPIWMEEGEEPESRHIAAKENTFIIRDGQLIVSNPPKAMTAADCLNRLSPSSGLSVYEDGKPVTGETRLKDGMTVRLAAGPDIWEELTVVLRSDSHPLKPDGDAVTGCHAPSGTVPVYTHIYTISDFSKASGIGISSAVYAADDGHDAPGSFVIKPAASLWKTGDAADLTPYTGGDNVGLALRFWFKTDTLTAGNRYTVQITSSAAWGSPCLQWSFDPAAFAEMTDTWTQVVLPFEDGTDSGFDPASFRWFRLFQSNETADDFSLFLDDIQLVRCGSEPVFDTAISGERVELLEPGTAGERFVLSGETPLVLSDGRLIPASLSGIMQAYLMLDMYLEDAQAVDFARTSLTASFGGDTENAMVWTLPVLETGWNRLVLPLGEGEWTEGGVTAEWLGRGPSYLFGNRIVCALDTLTLYIPTSAENGLILGDTALYVSEAEKPAPDEPDKPDAPDSPDEPDNPVTGANGAALPAGLLAGFSLAATFALRAKRRRAG